MKNTSERRQSLLESLCERRRDKVVCLAQEFGVCERTLRNDLMILSCSYPVYTRQGRDGGVFVAEGFELGRSYLTLKQAKLLRRLAIGLKGEDKETMDSIFTKFLFPRDMGDKL